jgi:hypothetical protein
MTTLSTLIGPGGSSLGLGGFAAPARRSFWQRVGGVFRRKLKPVTPAPESPTAVLSPDESAALTMQADALGDVGTVIETDLSQLSLSEDAAAAFIARVSDLSDDSGEALPRAADARTDADDIGLSDSTVGSGGQQPDDEGSSLLPPTTPRSELLWGNPKRDAALDEIRNGMVALASLLNGIQTHMEQQGARQDELALRQKELVACLSHLPAASAAQTENLAAIRDQMAQGSANQARLCAALERLSGLQETTGDALTSIGRRIEQMDVRDAGFAASMEKVCDAMQTVSRASETGAVVLDRVQNALTAREDKMTMVIERQQTRYSALMAIAIAVSAAALATVAGVGYLVISRMH